MSACADCKSAIDIEASDMCSVCEAGRMIADRDAWKARAEKAERLTVGLGHISFALGHQGAWDPHDALNTVMRILGERGHFEERATQAEAQAAAMRAKLRHHFKTGSLVVAAVIDDVCREDDMGRALLAELEALRECVGSVRVAGSLGDIVIALVRFDAAVDAARKGET